ncbi:glutamate-rich protein 3-like isoform X2 [Anneissia japonica]|uniref:glutamate-rich protein 3-like isoform X2 n=1 Tax=Anneissia japonica TaxID=1529436 RepID=UPI001425B546|nr:glutamate-rich protein 3-like isoform X2 [Anneissia japonica]
MSHVDSGPLASYNSLQDKHLAGYFNNTRMRRHLRRAGLVSKNGDLITETTYRLNMARKEHQTHVRDLLAQAIVHKALDIERHRQSDIKKKLEEIAKIELVRRVRMEKAHQGDEDIVPFLSPRDSRSGRPKSAVESTANHHPGRRRPYTAPSKRHKSTKKKPTVYVDNDGFPVHRVKHDPDSDSQDLDSSCLKGLDSQALNKASLHMTEEPDTGGKSPYKLDYAMSPQPPKGGRGGRSSSNRTPKRPIYTKDGKRIKAQSTRAGGYALHRKEPAYSHSVAPQTMCDVTVRYRGQSFKISYEKEDNRDEIMIYQQHCGGENLMVFHGWVEPGTDCVFTSRRHRGYPFGMTFYVNRVQVLTISACCEYKYKPGVILGGRKGHFRYVSVEGASPCYKCLVEAELAKRERDRYKGTQTDVPPKEPEPVVQTDGKSTQVDMEDQEEKEECPVDGETNYDNDDFEKEEEDKEEEEEEEETKDDLQPDTLKKDEEQPESDYDYSNDDYFEEDDEKVSASENEASGREEKKDAKKEHDDKYKSSSDDGKSRHSSDGEKDKDSETESRDANKITLDNESKMESSDKKRRKTEHSEDESKTASENEGSRESSEVERVKDNSETEKENNISKYEEVRDEDKRSISSEDVEEQSIQEDTTMNEKNEKEIRAFGQQDETSDQEPKTDEEDNNDVPIAILEGHEEAAIESEPESIPSERGQGRKTSFGHYISEEFVATDTEDENKKGDADVGTKDAAVYSNDVEEKRQDNSTRDTPVQEGDDETSSKKEYLTNDSGSDKDSVKEQSVNYTTDEKENEEKSMDSNSEIKGGSEKEDEINQQVSDADKHKEENEREAEAEIANMDPVEEHDQEGHVETDSVRSGGQNNEHNDRYNKQSASHHIERASSQSSVNSSGRDDNTKDQGPANNSGNDVITPNVVNEKQSSHKDENEFDQEKDKDSPHKKDDKETHQDPTPLGSSSSLRSSEENPSTIGYMEDDTKRPFDNKESTESHASTDIAAGDTSEKQSASESKHDVNSEQTASGMMKPPPLVKIIEPQVSPTPSIQDTPNAELNQEETRKRPTSATSVSSSGSSSSNSSSSSSSGSSSSASSESDSEKLKNHSDDGNTLDFSKRDLSPRGARKVAKALRKSENKNVQSLILSGNPIGDRGIKTIVRALVDQQKDHLEDGKKSKLAHVNLRDCKIGTSGVSEIAKFLKIHPGVETLNLGSNPEIALDGWKQLAEVLQNDSSLKSLNISDCEMGGDSSAALFQGLVDNESVIELDVEGNNLATDGGKCLLELVKDNGVITSIQFERENNLAPEIVLEIKEILETGSFVP